MNQNGVAKLISSMRDLDMQYSIYQAHASKGHVHLYGYIILLLYTHNTYTYDIETVYKSSWCMCEQQLH